MASSFNHTTPGFIASTTRTLAYGPVPAGQTVVVFGGTISNVDSTNNAQHWVTLESYDGSNYTTHLFQIPLPFGSSSAVPKIVLLPGESLYVTADAVNSVSARFELLVRS